MMVPRCFFLDGRDLGVGVEVMKVVVRLKWSAGMRVGWR
jgi:hypothetical protein